MDSSLRTEAARTCSSITPPSRWKGSGASRKGRRWSTRSPKGPRVRRRRTSGRPDPEFRSTPRSRPAPEAPGGFVRPELFQVPEEIEPHAVGAGHVVLVSGAVRDLVPVHVELGADREPGQDAGVVRKTAGEGESGGAGV